MKRLLMAWAAVVALGVLATTSAAHAVPVVLTEVASVSVGGDFSCVVTTAGGVKCWGWNYYGQLGDGTQADRSIAGEVTGLAAGVSAVSTSRTNGWDPGAGHTCALLGIGAIKCWGNNAHGQLGDGTTALRTTPVDVAGLAGSASAVSAGGRFTCALINSGAVQCWGANESGQLGNGGTTDSPTPVTVSGLSSGVTAISAGPRHACALTTGGGVKCWGANSRGELGDGTTEMRTTPVDVASLASGVAAISAGGAFPAPSAWQPGAYGSGHTCALTVGDGVKCWGANESGQLGEGTRNDRLVPFDAAGLTSGIAQVAAGGGIYDRVIAVGIFPTPYVQTCALTSAGTVKCWGSNSCGMVDGIGHCAQFDTFPTAVTVAGLPPSITAISAGSGLTCALAGGQVHCWGTGGAPQLVMTGTLPQSIAIDPNQPPLPIGQDRTLQATGGASGNPVVLTSLTPGTCSVSGTTVSGLAQGICVIAANQAGSANYDPAPQVTVDFRVGDPLPQTITFGPEPSVVVAGAGVVSATATSGLPVSFASTTPSICVVTADLVTGIALGNCTIAASQPGDELYGPAPQVTQTFPVQANNGTSLLRVTLAGKGTGTVTSAPAGLVCGSACLGNFTNNSSVSLTPVAGPQSYFAGWGGACSGEAGCAVTMSGPREVIAYFQSSIPRLANLSTRMHVGTGNDVLIGGFVIGGTQPKTIVVRARGPSLAGFGIPNLLMDPALYVVRSSDQAMIAANNDWQSGTDVAAIEASGYAPLHPAEPAIIRTLPPGAYTAIVGGTGVAIVEMFEVDRPEVPLVNISTRGQVLTGDQVMIGGFVIQGLQPQTVIVRARGPSLVPFGIANALANPTLQLVRSTDQSVVAVNDDWQAASNAAEVGASGFAPSEALESAILVTLPPGAYTAIVSGAGGGTGVGIVEVFALP